MILPIGLIFMRFIITRVVIRYINSENEFGVVTIIDSHNVFTLLKTNEIVIFTSLKNAIENSFIFDSSEI